MKLQIKKNKFYLIINNLHIITLITILTSCSNPLGSVNYSNVNSQYGKQPTTISRSFSGQIQQAQIMSETTQQGRKISAEILNQVTQESQTTTANRKFIPNSESVTFK